MEEFIGGVIGILLAIAIVTGFNSCNRKLDEIKIERINKTSECEKSCYPHPGELYPNERCVCVMDKEYK